MELSLTEIKRVCGDTVLVRAIQLPEKVRGFYVPMNARDNMKKARKQAWKGEVLKWGPDAEVEGFEFKKGAIVVIDPVAKDCQHFNYGENGQTEEFFFVKAEDLIGEEVAGR